MSGLDESWVLDSSPRKLREGLAPFERALRLHLEPALLRHGRVPDVVRGEEGCVERDVGRRREVILRRIVRGHVDDRVHVGLCRWGLVTAKHNCMKSTESNLRKVHLRNSRR